MKKFIFVFFILAFFLDLSFFNILFGKIFFGSGFFVAIVLAIFLLRSFREGLLWGGLGGILMDYFSSTPLGMNILIIFVLLLGLTFIRRKFLSARPGLFYPFFIFLLLIIFSDFLRFFLSYTFVMIGFGKPLLPFLKSSFVSYFFLKAFFSLLGVIIFTLFERIEMFLGESKAELKIK